MLLSNLIELLGYNALGVIKGLVAADVFRASGRSSKRSFASKAVRLAKRIRSLYFRSGLKDSRKKVVALSKFNLRL